MDEDKVIDVVLEEYKSLWHYYEILVKEWNGFVDAYFKIIAIPASIFGFLTVQESSVSGFTIDDKIGAAILGVIGLAGVALYIAYSKENKNGRAYEDAMSQIRIFLRSKHVDLPHAIVIDDLREQVVKRYSGKRERRWNIFGIKYWRGAAMLIINSALITASASVFFVFSSPFTWFLWFVILVILHTSLYESIMKEQMPLTRAKKTVG